MASDNHHGPRADIATATSHGFDEPYTWGRPPTTYLAPRQVARLLILRSNLETRRSVDASRAERN
jgi:hypothetical protein